MKKALILASGVLAFGVSACDVDQTEEGALPEVEVEGGNMPEFDVETADIEVETEETAIEVPTVDVEMPADADGEPVTGSE